jgi:peptidoglycan hydrolase CwlO-like protein
MGVSISLWLARIVCFHCSTVSNYKSKSYCKSNVSSTGTYNSHLPLFVITVLLIIGCIESNPGPTVEELILQVRSTLLGEINSSKEEGLERHKTLLRGINSIMAETLYAVNSLDGNVENISSQISDMRKSISDSNSRNSKLENKNTRLVSKIDQMECSVRKK